MPTQDSFPLKVNRSTKTKSPPHALQARKIFFESHHADNNRNRYAITIEDKTPLEIYNFWRDFKNLILFMKGLSEIVVLSPQKSHWVVRLKSGLSAEWDTKITQEIHGEMISWQSMPNSQITNKGAVYFTAVHGGKDTQVTLSMDYALPGGKITELVTALVGESPDQLTQINLRRLKAYLETGEIPTIEGQPHGENELPWTTQH